MAKENQHSEHLDNEHAPAGDEATQETKDQQPPDHADDETEQPNEDEHAQGNAAKPKPHHRIKHFWHWVVTHKKFTIPAAIVLLLALLAVIPYTRLTIAGLFVKQTITVEVVDAESGRPVSSAEITLGGARSSTDEEGRAQVEVKTGYHQLEVTKRYYKSFTQKVTVPLLSPSPVKATLEATGRPVPVKVVNAITQEPVSGITLEAEGTEARTDENGTVLMVMPADKDEVPVSLSGDGYNPSKATLKVTNREVPENTFSVTPAGKVYFLSNQSGKIDVVKTNLDGTDRQVVLEGTGEEIGHSTVLLASRDWRYLALLSRRDGGEYAKLFLIDTNDDSTTIMDEGEATFDLVGWSGHRFVYNVNRENKEQWEPKKEALKSFDAEAKDITTLAETNAEGSRFDHFYERFGRPYILADEIVYSVNIEGSYPQKLDGKEATLTSIKADGSGKRTLAGYAAPDGSSSQGLNVRAYNPNEVYFAVNHGDDDSLYEYEGGSSVETVEGETSNDLYRDNYFTYLVSPDGKQTFWTENRDGKGAMFVGNATGENGELVAALDTFTAYGWFTDDYLLISKNGSELYAMPVSGVDSEADLLKISNYYRPGQLYPGYGYGYGGSY